MKKIGHNAALVVLENRRSQNSGKTLILESVCWTPPSGLSVFPEFWLRQFSDLIIPVIKGWPVSLWVSSFDRMSKCPVSGSLLGPRIRRRTLFSKVSSLFCSLFWYNQVAQAPVGGACRAGATDAVHTSGPRRTAYKSQASRQATAPMGGQRSGGCGSTGGSRLEDFMPGQVRLAKYCGCGYRTSSSVKAIVRLVSQQFSETTNATQ